MQKELRGDGWHQPGAGSILQLGTRAQGNRCSLNRCSGKDLLKHCHISRQSPRILPPACSKHDLQRDGCSSTWYFPVPDGISRKGSPSLKIKRKKQNIIKNKKQKHPATTTKSTYVSKLLFLDLVLLLYILYFSYPFFSLVGFFHRLFREHIEQEEL